MLPRLIITAAIANIALSGVIIYFVFSYDKNVEPVESPLKNVKIVSIDKGKFQINNHNIKKDSEASTNPDKGYGKTLDQNELNTLLQSRNPFGTSPIVDKQYKEEEIKYQKKMEEMKKKIEQQLKDKAAKEAGATGSVTQTDQSQSLDNMQNNASQPNTSSGNTTSVGTAKPDSENLVKKTLTKAEAKKIATEKGKKYDIPVEWIMSIIDEQSHYQSDLVTTKDGVARKGIMQFREEKARFIAESIGVYYRPSLDLNATMNIEMGAWYLDYLRKQIDDQHYVFSAFYLGETKAKSLKASKGNYESNFSRAIMQTMKTI